MKTITLTILTLLFTVSGFSKSNNGTIVETFPVKGWETMVFCDGNYIGDLKGDVIIKARFNSKNNWILYTVTGTMQGTGMLKGENFEIKYQGQQFSNFTQPDFKIELHFIAKGDQGTKIINFGTFDLDNGPASIRSKCL